MLDTGTHVLHVSDPDGPAESAREQGPRVLLQATRSRGGGQDVKGRVTRTYNRQIRIAMVQALCDGIDKSDAQDKQELDPGNRSGT